ncbi:MAG: hypothetical protein PHQ89_01525 [Bacilli bacterium]|nr:hypothetical protein [Bacilli bacterium]
MKKLIFLFLVFILNINSIKALDNNFWSEELILDNSKIELINTERRYAWYKEETVYSDKYFIEGYTEAPFTDIIRDDYIVTDFTSWTEGNLPDRLPNRVIESKPLHKYRELKPARYIFFTDMIGGYNSFKISEINIMINNVSVDYDIECTNCSNDFSIYVKNDIENENNSYVGNGGSFRIDLKDSYSIGLIKIEMYMKDTTPSTKKCNIAFKEGSNITDPSIASSVFKSYIVSFTADNPFKYVIYPDSTWDINPIYQDWVYIDGILNATYYRQMLIVSEHRYQDTLYKYSGIAKNYMEGFHIFVEDNNYIKDEDIYKDYYKYRYIEEPVLKDLEIKQDEQLINNAEEVLATTEEKEDEAILKENLIGDSKVSNDLNKKNISIEEITCPKKKCIKNCHIICQISLYCLIAIIILLIIKEVINKIRHI